MKTAYKKTFKSIPPQPATGANEQRWYDEEDKIQRKNYNS